MQEKAGRMLAPIAYSWFGVRYDDLILCVQEFFLKVIDARLAFFLDRGA